MTKEQRMALLLTQAVLALITTMSMLSNDLYQVHLGEGMIYTQEAYEKVITALDLSRSQTIQFLKE
jgi:hypothetical protein